MTVPVPTSVPATSGWAVFDWLDRSYSTPAAGADGVALLTRPPVPEDQRWQVTHMVVGCTSATATQMRLYFDDVSNGNLRDGTSSGGFDVADWPQGLWVPPGRALVARWTGATVGAVGTLTLQATILRRT
jgi:hypothetical protein